METLEQIWMSILWLFTSPQANSLTMAFCAMMTFVSAYKFVPELVNDYWPHSAERRGVGLVRAAVNLTLIAGLTLASAAIVQAMRQP